MNRTLDTKIFSLLLYRLSYLPTGTSARRAFAAVLIRTCPDSPLQQPSGRDKALSIGLGRAASRYCLSAATRDSTKSITLASRLASSSRSIS